MGFMCYLISSSVYNKGEGIKKIKKKILKGLSLVSSAGDLVYLLNKYQGIRKSGILKFHSINGISQGVLELASSSLPNYTDSHFVLMLH